MTYLSITTASFLVTVQHKFNGSAMSNHLKVPEYAIISDTSKLNRYLKTLLKDPFSF